jgi:adenylate cyclase
MRRRRALAAVAAVAAVVAAVLSLSGALGRLEAWTLEARFAVRGAEPAAQVAVVEITDSDIAAHGRWPLRRSLHARAIDALRRAGARVVAYDVQFTEPGPRWRDDVALLEAVERTPGTVLSTTTGRRDGRTTVLGGERNLDRARARAANTLLPSGHGGELSRVPYRVHGLESFAVAAAESFTGRPVAPDGFDALIDFHGGPGAVPTYSFTDLLEARLPAGALRGRVAVVGASAPSLQDLHPTPTSGDGLMPGPEVQANAISTVLRGLPLREAPGWLGLLAALALAALAPLAALRLRALSVALLGLAVLFTGLAGAQALFAAGLVVPVAAPAAALALGLLGALLAGAAIEASERRRTRALFGRFVPGPVVDELLARGDAGGRAIRQDATVLFCDLRGFTAFAEWAAPELVIDLLNHYLAEVTEGILAHGGTVVSYLGDGVMAVFGSPLARDDHAITAVRAAHELAGERLDSFNAWLAERGLEPFALGIGVNSGPVMSGLVGSERRMEYAAVGDTTNVAARLQAATKDTPHSVYVAETTWSALDDITRARLAPAGELTLSGRDAAITVHAPRDRRRSRRAA